MNDYLPAIIVGAMLVIFAIQALVFALHYKRVGPDEALVITGMKHRNGQTERIVLAGGTFVWPVLEQARRLSLAPVPISASSGRFLAEGHVRIRKDRKAVAKAAERFLSMSPQELGKIAGQVVEGLLAAGDVPAKAAEALEPLGLEIVSLSVKDRS